MAAIAADALAVDTTNVYFVLGNALMRVPVGGGAAVTMLALSAGPRPLLGDVGLLVTSAGVVVHYRESAEEGEKIVRVPIGDDAVSTLATTSGPVSAFGGTESDVYFVDASGTHAVPVSGGAVRLLTDRFSASTAGGGRGSLAVVGASLLATSSAQGGSVVAVPLQGGPPSTLASGQPNASFAMACGPDVCWWTGATPSGAAGATGSGAIVRRNASGAVTVVGPAPFYPASMAFDGVAFYETVACDACLDGSIWRIPLDGGAPIVVGRGRAVVVHGTCAYWSTESGISSASTSQPKGV